MNIYINGKQTYVARQEVTYEQILAHAGFDPKRIITVTYRTRRSSDEQRQGTMTPGKVVAAEDGMLFDACDTSNA
jgi:hypothetical protein